MAYALSPGVTVVEKDFTSIVPAVSSSTGAFAGGFAWGPVLYPVQITSENQLVQLYGKPTDSNFEDFFTAANFLSYTSSLYVNRKDSAAGVNAVSNAGTAVKIKNVDHYGTLSLSGFDFAAKYVGTLGNSLKISYADSATYRNTIAGSASVALSGTALTGTGTNFLTSLFVGAVLRDSSGNTVGTVTAISTDTAATISAAQVALSSASGVTASWYYYDQFDGAPGTSSYATKQNATNDELHVIVIDEDGAFTGSANAVLEKFAYVSKASDARKYDGTNNYYKDVINNTSQYIWWGRHTTNVAASGSAWGSVAAGLTFKSLLTGTSSVSTSSSLAGGVDDYTDSSGSYAQGAWIQFLDDTQYDISLLPVGKATATTANYVIQNLAEVRQDCVVFCSASTSTATVILDSSTTAYADATTYRNAITSSSYGVLDSGWKYQYDRYNDKYRWVPLNGDTAGLCARTDYTNDSWWSPAGFSRGQIKNVVKLGLNPNKSYRDTLYKQGINPIVAFPGQGVVLYGDKTLQGKPSAFDRINVRRLFITLEKSIKIASNYQLFEFNDAFTRAQFKALVEPFLRDVQGRRGITDFKVVCDESNNTGQVIDSNQFVGDIYIKPARSINFITLNFIATKTGVDFSTVGG